jgi:3,4-dihydroxy 2-butanone 4-phosphate synthase/GTP cyclohydrolase II
MALNSITEIIDDIRQGKMVILMDDEDRENEGDLIIAAEAVTPEIVTFFAREACGLICLPITEEKAIQLNLPLMVDKNKSTHTTNFTVSIEAATGTTTGISAADRARTVQAAIAPNAKPEDIIQPGHIFPLIAKQGGVLSRAGHTEAGVDLARLGGYQPAALIVEIMNEDGTMAQRPQLEAFAAKHNLKIGTIADLIEYRAMNDKTVERIEQKTINTNFGEFDLHVFHDREDNTRHYALSKGTINAEKPTLVRVQTLNTLRDIFQTVINDDTVTWSLPKSLQHIAEAGEGVLVLVGQQENDDSLLEQIRMFPELPKPEPRSVSEEGQIVYRVIGAGSQILSQLGVGKMRIMGPPTRYNGISGFHLEVVEFVND